MVKLGEGKRNEGELAALRTLEEGYFQSILHRLSPGTIGGAKLLVVDWREGGVRAKGEAGGVEADRDVWELVQV